MNIRIVIDEYRFPSFSNVPGGQRCYLCTCRIVITYANTFRKSAFSGPIATYRMMLRRLSLLCKTIHLCDPGRSGLVRPLLGYVLSSGRVPRHVTTLEGGAFLRNQSLKIQLNVRSDTVLIIAVGLGLLLTRSGAGRQLPAASAGIDANSEENHLHHRMGCLGDNPAFTYLPASIFQIPGQDQAEVACQA